MKTLLLIAVLAAVIVLLVFLLLGIQSKSGAAPGLKGGALSQCPTSPNCACSEYLDDRAHYVMPINYDPVDPAAPLEPVKAIILKMGGELPEQTGPQSLYLAATFTSRFFRFVDDLELRYDAESKLLHIRSASRVGHSDLGVNAKRVEAIRQHLQN